MPKQLVTGSHEAAVSPFRTMYVGTAGMVMGGADVAKAADQGMKNEELGIAYLAGPEVAQRL